MVSRVRRVDDEPMLHAGAITSVASKAFALRTIAPPLALIAVAALFVPLMLATPAHLSSDESLYVAEAYNIATGKALTYPSGDAITHRAPLYPLLLAPAVRAGGPDAARVATKLVMVVNAGLVVVLGWRLSGPLAGWIEFSSTRITMPTSSRRISRAARGRAK